MPTGDLTRLATAAYTPERAALAAVLAARRCSDRCGRVVGGRVALLLRCHECGHPMRVLVRWGRREGWPVLFSMLFRSRCPAHLLDHYGACHIHAQILSALRLRYRSARN